MNREEIIRDIEGLTGGTPHAMMMVGKNPIAPNCPTNGAYGVSTWARTTKHMTWKKAPEGWDTLVAREEAGEGIGSFVVIWKDGDGFCVPLDSDCAVGLFTAPSRSAIEDIVDWICPAEDEW